MPQSAGMARKNCSNASSDPAEPPSPTTANYSASLAGRAPSRGNAGVKGWSALRNGPAVDWFSLDFMGSESTGPCAGRRGLVAADARPRRKRGVADDQQVYLKKPTALNPSTLGSRKPQ